jgi:nucleoside-diphosphate-sugar epimerase
MKKKLLLVGIGSLVGQNLSELDLSSYEICYTTRDVQKCGNDSSYIHFDLDNTESTLKNHHFDVCVYMADLPKIFTLVNSGASFDRLIAFSTSSVLTKAKSTHASDIQLVNEFKSAELSLKDWCTTESVSCVILQPTLIYDIGRDRNLTVIKSFIDKYKFFPLVGNYRGLRKPVSAVDLGLLVVAILVKQAWSHQFMIFTVSGGETMSFKELLERIFFLSGARPIFFPINKKIFNLALKFLNTLGLMRNIGTEMIDHAEMDFIFDNAPIYREFGFVPKALISGAHR